MNGFLAQPALDPARRTGLIFCGMGGPDGPEAVEPFLRNLFRDPCILPVPRLLTPILSRLIAKRRAPFVRERYAMISDDSSTPQLQTTIDQARETAHRLAERGLDVVEGVAMRYWKPFPEECVQLLLDRGAEQFLVVPAYPQYACATTGSTLKFVRDGIEQLAPGAVVHDVHDWHLLPGYVAALAEPVAATIRRWATVRVDPRECALLYVAHSLPEKFVQQGDPYLEQVTATVQAVHDRVSAGLSDREGQHFLTSLGSGQGPRLTYQSKVGPIKWLGPEITEEIHLLSEVGVRRVFVQPISFTCEHVETLHELDIELKEDIAAFGIEDYARGPALNLNADWLDSLAGHLFANTFAQQPGQEVSADV